MLLRTLLAAAAIAFAIPAHAADHPVHGLSCVAKSRIIVKNSFHGKRIATLKKGDHFDIKFSKNTADLVQPGYQIIDLPSGSSGWIKDDDTKMNCDDGMQGPPGHTCSADGCI